MEITFLLILGEMCTKKVDLVFAFDSSGGLPRSSFNQARDFAVQLIGQFHVGSNVTKLGVFTFSKNVRVQFHLKDAIDLTQLKKLPYRPDKNQEKHVNQAMNFIRETMFIEQNGDRNNVPNVVLIITDGFTGANREIFAEAQRAMSEQRGIEVLQIVWNQIGPELPSDEKVFNVDSASALMGVTDKVTQSICDIGVP